MSEENREESESDGRFARNREWIALAQAGDENATEKLLQENTGLLRHVVMRFRDRGVETEDLMQIGTLGMLRAIRSFELERDTAFSTYAVPLIIGEIKRYLRDDGMIRVSRQYKSIGARLMFERNRIMTEEGREARIEELAGLCETTPAEAAVALDAISPITSLSEGVGNDGEQTVEAVLPDEESAAVFEKIDDKLSLSQAISRLPPAWRQIILLRYYRGHTQQSTAELLGLTQVKVSREEKKILLALRQELGG